jgi:hypothetical protein
MVATPDPETHNRTPQELAREALELARAARSNNDAMRANTMAIVALAGEVHALTEGSQEPVTLKFELSD